MVRRFFARVVAMLAIVVLTFAGGDLALADQQESYTQSEQAYQSNSQGEYSQGEYSQGEYSQDEYSQDEYSQEDYSQTQGEYSQSQDDYSYSNNQSNQ
ncbi:MAG: hypothetical protein VKL39_04000 [Leptolyngbyaceae bacterium]|nr:hypothetical protein [Leptolyngbyaceae bacterium]